jgi:thioredoxin reductase
MIVWSNIFRCVGLKKPASDSSALTPIMMFESKVSVMQTHEISKRSDPAVVDVAIIGAGPYGLSIAAHLRQAGLDFRIFGEPMLGWLAHMPNGMRLKSEGFASNLYDPNAHFTLKKFCAERAIPYADIGLPVHLETFAAYGVDFQRRLVPNLERKVLVDIGREANRFRLHLDDGEVAWANKVVLATGIADFGHVPNELCHLPPEFVSHSSRHANLQLFKGRRVAVIGGGSSAIDLADLLFECGTHVQLIARRAALRFHNPPTGQQRSLWQNIRYPMTGMGPGLRARLYTDAPLVFHCLPERIRHGIILDFAPPEGGWFSKDRVLGGGVPLLLGYSLTATEVQGGEVHLRLLGPHGSERLLATDHVIVATGYRVDLTKLSYLSDGIRSHLKLAYGRPILSASFESSVPGLFFAGLPTALSFGPMMRFALGAGYTARRLTRALKAASKRGSVAYAARSQQPVSA